jgi:hypothetical protein
MVHLGRKDNRCRWGQSLLGTEERPLCQQPGTRLRRLGSLLRLIPIGVLFGAAEISLHIAPLPAVARWFGTELAADAESSSGEDPWQGLDITLQRRLGRARRVGARWPFGKGGCLRQSLVEARLLRRHHPRLRIGVARGPRGEVEAHAWIELDGHTASDISSYARLMRVEPPAIISPRHRFMP